MACVVESAAIRKRIVGVGDGEVIAVGGGAEVDHAPAVVADFKKQAGMLAAQLFVDVVVGANGVIADVG